MSEMVYLLQSIPPNKSVFLENFFYRFQIRHSMYNIGFKIAAFCPFVPCIYCNKFRLIGVFVNIFLGFLEKYFKIFGLVIDNQILFLNRESWITIPTY